MEMVRHFLFILDLFYILRINEKPRSYHEFNDFYKAISNVVNNEMEKQEYRVNLSGEDEIMSLSDYENLTQQMETIFNNFVNFISWIIVFNTNYVFFRIGTIQEILDDFLRNNFFHLYIF